MYSRLITLLAFLALLLPLAGCGPKRPPLAKVEGTVTYKGKPVVGAAIAFLPEQQGLMSGRGKTDDKGHYVLETYDPGDGAIVGKHQVVLSLRGPSKPLRPDLGEAAAEVLKEMGPPLIPKKYFAPETSGLTREVVEGKKNVFDFELKD